MKSKYEWSDDMREISGFGGGYESTCRAMVTAGLEWFDDNPKADPKFHVFKNITGIIMEDNEDAKELSKAVVDGSKGDCTGAMHQYCVSHVLRAHAIGWKQYCKEMKQLKKEETQP